jgi:hypothetical protein
MSDFTTIPYRNILLDHGFRVMASPRYRHCRVFWKSCLPSCLTGAAYRDFLRNVLPEMLQVVDLQARSQLWRCSTTFSSYISGILEQDVSGAVDETRSINSMACSLPFFKPLRISSLRKSKLYSLCYSISWRPALANNEQNESVMIGTTAGIFQLVKQS